MKKAHGGFRPGAGRKSGGKNASTITKEAIRARVRELVAAHVDDLVASQIANAKGLKYLVVREKGSGKFVRVTEAMAKAKLGQSEEIIEVWEKEPSTPAFTDLLNRAADKPIEAVEISGKDGQPLEVRWLS